MKTKEKDKLQTWLMLCQFLGGINIAITVVLAFTSSFATVLIIAGAIVLAGILALVGQWIYAKHIVKNLEKICNPFYIAEMKRMAEEYKEKKEEAEAKNKGE